MSPRRSQDDDLFATSTMSFGEHLEELRKRLFRSVIGLGIGFLIGLLVGTNVVSVIQIPLTKALTSYYERQAQNFVEKKLVQMEAEGVPLPDDPAKLKRYVTNAHMMPREIFVDIDSVINKLKLVEPERFASLAAPETEISADGDYEPNLVQLFLWAPTQDDPRLKARSLNPHEAFVIFVKASLLVGILIASPYIFYQIWSFVAAGLYPHERKYIHIFLPFSICLFLLGAALAFFFVFEPVLDFLLKFNEMLGIDIDPRISEWLSFVLVLPLGFGVSFQLPLVMLFLERIGIMSVKTYLSNFRIAVLVIFVLSMFLTPADPWSMCLMAIPLTILYFGGVLLCKFMPRNKSPFEDAEAEG
jgi:sec-independent protein translocase protein TatC